MPAVIPVTQLSFRGQIGELAGSMFLAVVLSLLATLPWVSLLGRRMTGNRLELLGSLFFLTVAVELGGPAADQVLGAAPARRLAADAHPGP